MPKILIRDEDLTTAVGSITSSYGVFVPGLPGYGVSEYPKVATEFTSLTSFKSAFGNAPLTIGNNFVDPGYMYACELLGAGLPVIYKVIPVKTTYTNETESVTVSEDKIILKQKPITDNTTTYPITFYDEERAPISGITVEQVDELETGFEVTLSGDASALSSIVSISYYYVPEEYVDSTTVTAADICNRMLEEGTFFEEIKDRGLYDVSFVTTGGYPTVWTDADGTKKSLIPSMTSVFGGDTETTKYGRGDCFVLIDFEQSTKFKPSTDGTKIVDENGNDITQLAVESKPEDCLVVAPWCEFTPNFSGYSENYWFPGSFAFLKCFAGSIKTNNSWFATAGVKRGAVNCSGVSQVITNAEADLLQPVAGRAVNAITYIKPFGYVIYGNRTLRPNSAEGLVANSFVNIRQLVHDVKRHVYSVAKGLMFDPNNDILWVNFKNAVTPLLERMRSGQGISSYRLVRIQNSARGTLSAKIIIAPIEAVETFDITVELTDEDITVAG